LHISFTCGAEGGASGDVEAWGCQRLEPERAADLLEVKDDLPVVVDDFVI